MHDNLCKHLGIDSSTNHPDRYSNLFLNDNINRHVHAKYLIKALRVLMGTAVFKRASLQIGRF